MPLKSVAHRMHLLKLPADQYAVVCYLPVTAGLGVTSTRMDAVIPPRLQGSECHESIEGKSHSSH